MLSEYRNTKGGQVKGIWFSAVVAVFTIATAPVLSVFMSPIIGLVWLLISLLMGYSVWRKIRQVSDENTIRFDGLTLEVTIGGRFSKIKSGELKSLAYDEEGGEITLKTNDGEVISFSTSHVFTSVSEARKFEREVLKSFFGKPQLPVCAPDL